MATLPELKGFDVDAAEVSLWLFKGPNGPSNLPPEYTGRWIETTDEVDAVLKEIVVAEVRRVEETFEYDLLAQNNEASALMISIDETHADFLTNAAAAETEAKKVLNERHLRNAKFYLVKLEYQGTTLYAVRRTTNVWRTKRALSVSSIFYVENRLDIDLRPHFELEKNIDFVIFDGDLFILSKSGFESILRYKEGHINDFLELQAEQEFVSVFADVTPLVEHVGTNKIRLRRISALRQKAHYRDAEFMDRLREHHAAFGFAIQFDDQGKIIATPETGAEILTALLDHRLSSAFSKLIYDVPSTTTVQV